MCRNELRTNVRKEDRKVLAQTSVEYASKRSSKISREETSKCLN